MKNNKLFSSFLGGFFGILLSGYAYYLSGKHNFYLVPMGTFLGSLIGFSWHNLKEIMNRVAALTKHWRFLGLKAMLQFIIKLHAFAQKKLQQKLVSGVLQIFLSISKKLS